MTRARLVLIVIGLACAAIGVLLDSKPVVGVAIVALAGSLVLRLIILAQNRRAKVSAPDPASSE
ncbi:MAG TPA: hypothetical protein VLT17_09180 [Gemmatimonadales bacterium]|nr:hypothetical protein [Gemmatimonadales bacterium]